MILQMCIYTLDSHRIALLNIPHVKPHILIYKPIIVKLNTEYYIDQFDKN